MAKETAAEPRHTQSDNVAMLEIAWEMTKQYLSASPHAEITAQGLRDEFAKNVDAVYKAWEGLGNGKGGSI
jgi:hypothetical protein